MKKALSEIMLSARVRLIQGGGVLAMLLGLFLSTVGVHEAAGGTSIVIDWLPPFVVEVDQVLGLVFSIVGIASLVCGIALCYVGFKLQRLNVACMILGSCGLVIPSMIVGIFLYVDGGLG